MAAYRRVYDSRHRQDDAKNRDHLQNPTLGNEYGLPLPYTFFAFRMCTCVRYFTNIGIR